MNTAKHQLDNGNDKQLEAAVDRVLKGLPPLHAPDTLIPRVLAAIEPAASMRWYRRPWQSWPVALQIASLAVAIASGAGLYVGIGEILHALRGTYLAAQVNTVLSTFLAIYQLALTLANAMWLVVQRLGTGWLIACGLIVLFSYIACIGLGTIFARLAWARNSQN